MLKSSHLVLAFHCYSRISFNKTKQPLRLAWLVVSEASSQDPLQRDRILRWEHVDEVA